MKNLKLLFIIFFATSFMGQVYANNYQGNWRWRNDDGNETTATWKVAEKTAITLTDKSNLRLRIEYFHSDYDTSRKLTNTFGLGYKKSSETTWTQITDDSSVNAFVISNSNNITDGTPTTKQLTNVYSSFSPGNVMTNSFTSTIVDYYAQTSFEFEFCIKPTNNITYNESYDFCLGTINNGFFYIYNYTTKITLITPKASPSVTTSPVTTYDTNSGLMGGEVTNDNGFTVTERGVVYNTTGSPTTSNSIVQIGDGVGTFSQTVTGLSAGTKYYVRSYAINSEGTSYGNEESFTTDALALDVSATEVSIENTEGSLAYANVTSNTSWNVSSNQSWLAVTVVTPQDAPRADGSKVQSIVPPSYPYSGNKQLKFTAGANPNATTRTATITVSANGLTSKTITITQTATLIAPTVTTQAVSDISTTTATGNGNLIDLGQPFPSAYGVCWSTNETPTVDDFKSTVDGDIFTGSFTSAITGLSPNTTYYVRAFATNSAGTGYGEQVTFATDPLSINVSETEVNIENTEGSLAYANVTSNTSWNVNSDQSWLTVTVVTPQDAPRADVSKVQSIVPPSYPYSGNKQLKFTAGANPNATTRTATITVSANGLTSKTITITQAATLIAPTVTTQDVTDKHPTTATGNGNITDLGQPNPTAYGVCWNTTGTPTIDDSKVDNGAITTTGAFTASMTGLTANTTYFVRAYVTNLAGTSYGEEVSFCTCPFVGTVSTENASNVSTTTATGNGTILSLGVPNPTAYGVCWSTNETPTIEDTKTDEGATSVTGAFTSSITGLLPDTKYYVRAYVTNTAGTYYGEEVSFTTDALSLEVSNSAVSIENATGSLAYANVTSNTNWNVNSDQSWLTVTVVTPQDAPRADVSKVQSIAIPSYPYSGNKQLKFTAGANSTSASRDAIITVSASGLSSKTITITQAAGVTTDINPVENNVLLLYPNPTSNGFYINAGDEKTNLNIYNLSGALVYSQQVIGKSYINISQLKVGLYMVKANEKYMKLIKN